MAKPNGMSDRKPVSLVSRQRMSKAKLSIKQQRFAREYADLGNAAEAARKAGYKPKAAKEMGYENLTKPHVRAAVDREMARVEAEFTADRVQRRLDEISHNAERDGHYSPAVRAEELIGKAAGMWVDQSINLAGALSDTHISALIQVAKRRQQEPTETDDDDEAEA